MKIEKIIQSYIDAIICKIHENDGTIKFSGYIRDVPEHYKLCDASSWYFDAKEITLLIYL